MTRVDYVEFCKNFNSTTLVPGKYILQYVRSKNGQPKGAMVAYRGDDNKIYVGYSLCNIKVDKFDKQIAKYKAIERAVGEEVLEDWAKNLPQSLVVPLDNFLERAQRFFKE